MSKAAKLVQDRREAVLILMQKIDAAVCGMGETWGDAGSLGHVQEELQNLAEFLGVVEVEGEGD